MSAELASTIGFGAAALVSSIMTRLAIEVAVRTDFYDHPREYRQHDAATPFLGGTAVLIAFLGAAGLVGVGGRLLVPLVCAVGMWLLGTVDDRVAVAPKWRLLAAAGAGIALTVAGLGWNTSAGEPVNVVLTVVWIVGFVNAFNLMDNLDGACSTVGVVTAAGIGILAAIKGQTTVAGLAFALSGACAGFIPWNLSRPAKIFLGDGGSMPIGFLVATLAAATARHAPAGNAGLLLGALLVGLPILDTALVVFSRTRRGVTLVTGGRDHLTHRILLVLHSPRAVAGALAIAQAALCLLAIMGYEFGTVTLVVLAFAAFAAGVATVVVLDTPRWRPAGIAMGPQEVVSQPANVAPITIDSS